LIFTSEAKGSLYSRVDIGRYFLLAGPCCCTRGTAGY